jgi:hypothetical protein
MRLIFPLKALAYLLLPTVILFGLLCADAADRKLTVVTELGVPPGERSHYFAVLKQDGLNAIASFLTNIRLTPEQVANEMKAVNLKVLAAGNCLAQETISEIYQALITECAPKADEESISSIILPKFFQSKNDTQVATSFFPYGLNQLKADPRASSRAIEYVEPYPRPSTREVTMTLIVLSFLNLYWEGIKEKPKLTEIEYSIIYNGFGTYSYTLQKLCPQFPDFAERKKRLNIAEEGDKISKVARTKMP